MLFHLIPLNPASIMLKPCMCRGNVNEGIYKKERYTSNTLNISSLDSFPWLRHTHFVHSAFANHTNCTTSTAWKKARIPWESDVRVCQNGCLCHQQSNSSICQSCQIYSIYQMFKNREMSFTQLMYVSPLSPGVEVYFVSSRGETWETFVMDWSFRNE